jgi:hypothetical protein
MDYVKRHCTIFAAKQMSYVIYDDVHSDLYCVLHGFNIELEDFILSMV